MSTWNETPNGNNRGVTYFYYQYVLFKYWSVTVGDLHWLFDHMLKVVYQPGFTLVHNLIRLLYDLLLIGSYY